MKDMLEVRGGAAGNRDHSDSSFDEFANIASNVWKEVGGLLQSLQRQSKLDASATRKSPEQAGSNENFGSLTLPKLDLNNHWHFDKSATRSIDKITTKAEITVQTKDFVAQNPGSAALDLASSVGKDGFKVRHATTGEVDGGWKLSGLNKDGSVSLTKDYAMSVASKNKHNGLLESMPGVPPEHTKSLQSKLAELPPNILRALNDKGYKVIATPTNTEAIPELKGLTPRGWSKDLTFDHSDGTHDNIRRLILAPQRFKSGDEFMPVERPEVLIHQIGHALDHAYGKLSNDADFQKAFKEDMKALGEKGWLMSEREKQIYNYFNQKDGPGVGERPGSEEAFASLFGMILTGPENPEDKIPFEQNFPNTIKVVRNKIAKL